MSVDAARQEATSIRHAGLAGGGADTLHLGRARTRAIVFIRQGWLLVTLM
jgi:hypothetical protein